MPRVRIGSAPPDQEALDVEIARLRDLDVKALRAQWRNVLGRLMPLPDDRNILKFGPPKYPGEVEITPAMVESVRQRLKEAGGVLTVWAVLHEDVYETQFGDGFYLHAHGLALNSADAQRLAALGGGDKKLEKWHVRSYRLGLENDLPVFTAEWHPEEEFRIGDFVVLLCEIPPGGTASKLLTGTGLRKDGPLLSLP